MQVLDIQQDIKPETPDTRIDTADVLEYQLVRFVSRTNWFLLIGLAAAGFCFLEDRTAWGILLGGLIVTVNFHLLTKTIKSAFQPNRIPSHNVILAKYYLRFLVSGIIIFLLIWTQTVNPLGLIAGLSIVVASFFLATAGEIKKLLVNHN